MAGSNAYALSSSRGFVSYVRFSPFWGISTLSGLASKVKNSVTRNRSFIYNHLTPDRVSFALFLPRRALRFALEWVRIFSVIFRLRRCSFVMLLSHFSARTKPFKPCEMGPLTTSRSGTRNTSCGLFLLTAHYILGEYCNGRRVVYEGYPPSPAGASGWPNQQ
jgi:hypothetical protein